MTYKCPNCGNTIEYGVSRCPYCRTQISWSAQEEKGFWDEVFSRKSSGGGCLSSFLILCLIAGIAQCAGCDTDDNKTGSDTQTEINTVGGKSNKEWEDILKRETDIDLKSLISIKPLSNSPKYDYEFTVEEYMAEGLTCKRDGYIQCYADGKISKVDIVSLPYDIKDSKGKAVTPGWEDPKYTSDDYE